MKFGKLFTAGILLILMTLLIQEKKKNAQRLIPSSEPVFKTSESSLESIPTYLPIADLSLALEPYQIMDMPLHQISYVENDPSLAESVEEIQLISGSSNLSSIVADANSNETSLETNCPPDCLPEEKCLPETCPPCEPCVDPDPCPPFEVCPEPDPCIKCAQLWPSCGPDWIITPNAGPCVANGADVFLTGEFIYWAIRQDHLAFAFSTPVIVDPFVVPSGKGSVFHPDWDFEPGFKIGLGLLFDHDGWDLYANYTWIHESHSHKRVSLKDGFFLRDFEWGRTTSTQNDNQSIQDIAAIWKLESFNVIDLELGRNFFVSRYLQLRPHFGLKGTWQEQKFFVTIASRNVLNAEELITSSQHKMCYWGVGVRTGLDSSWHFTNCFSFFAEAALAALWECFDVDAEVIENNISLGIISEFLNTENTFYTIKPLLELYMGLRFEAWFCCNAFHISIEAGWEEQWWSDQNQFFSFSSESRLGDLVLQGLTAKLRFDF